VPAKPRAGQGEGLKISQVSPLCVSNALGQWRQPMQVRALPIATVLLAGVIALPPSQAHTQTSAQPATVWFAPAGGTPDLIALFSDPQLWAKARGQINVMKFGPGQVEIAKMPTTNGFAALQQIDAFRKLRQWGIAIAIEAPAVKEWDCSGRGVTKDPRVRGDAKGATLSYIKNVYTAGASVKFIAMDEPMVSGLGACHQSIDETAEKTAGYAKALLANSNTPTWAPNLAVGDIEAYPSKTVEQLEQWVSALEKDGFRPAFFHLDVDVHDVETRGPKLNFAADMQTLKSFFRARGIPFGIVFWGGYDPESSDLSYYAHVIAWAKRVHAAIGPPEQSIFQSWVRRSSVRCTAGVHCGPSNNWMCAPPDPVYCGKGSMPINLPENDQAIYSHTRLISDSLAILKQPAGH
jgi:hypothetical protein